MRFGINCISLNPQYRGGINTYTFGLLEGFRRVGMEHTFQIYATAKNLDCFRSFTEAPNFKVIQVPLPLFLLRALLGASMLGCPQSLFRIMANSIWRHAVAIQESNSDIIYTPTTNLFPYCYRTPTLISMHDIQYIHFPQFFSFRELQAQRLMFPLSARHVDFIQNSCEFIKKDILEHFPVLKPDQLVVIRDGIDPEIWRPAEPQPEAAEIGVPVGRFLFYPAQLWPHKDHMTVLRALHLLKQQGRIVPLVLTGGAFGAAAEIFEYIKKAGIQDQVHYLGKVPLDQLKNIYQRAHFVITATLYESNSLTLLEAAAMRRPLIASRTPPNVELAAQLEINLFEPRNHAELALLINRLWDDESTMGRQVAHNVRNMQYFSWDRVARDYLAACMKIGKRS